ncbi:MAG: hypothetical protein R8K53_05570 [Mariprofundaceae bacterium]
MNKNEYLGELAQVVVSNNWDLSTSGREVNLSNKYHGPDNLVQEKLKEEGRKRIKSPAFNQRLIGYGLEASGWFYRSLQLATEQGRKHPEEFSEYFSHLLHSDPSHVAKEEYKKLSSWFVKPTKVKIKKGKTLWH